jgi:hypothetical protein
MAGYLTGALLLLADGPVPELDALTRSFATSLERRVRARPARAWQRDDATRFAHGWTGALYAILAHRRWREEHLPTWLASALAQLAAVWSPPDLSFALRSSWCNGAAGATMLWTKVYECTGDRSFLDAARFAARVALEAGASVSSLCCGDGGVAYALLALHRVDPEQPWKSRAHEVAAAAVGRLALRWPNGLFEGHPGLVCLALDCLDDDVRGFPGVEA